jgi:hypothetical protein
MTTLITRQPLQTLSMSSSQRGPRRLSARLQEKEDAQPHTNGYHPGSKNQPLSSTNDNSQARRAQDKPPATKKRRIGESAQTLAWWSYLVGRRLTELQNMMKRTMVSYLRAQKHARLGPLLRRSHQSQSKAWPERRMANIQRSTIWFGDMRNPIRRSLRRSGEPECHFQHPMSDPRSPYGDRRDYQMKPTEETEARSARSEGRMKHRRRMLKGRKRSKDRQNGIRRLSHHKPMSKETHQRPRSRCLSRILLSFGRTGQCEKERVEKGSDEVVWVSEDGEQAP